MHTFRVAYPADPQERGTFFERLNSRLSHFGKIEGTSDGGSFEGSTPVGKFSGTYRALDGSDEMEIEIRHKPFLIPGGVIEHEAKKFFAHFDGNEASEG
jgi:hypothetical protein